MSNSNVSIELQVNGQPFIFLVDAVDGNANEELLNLVSARSIGSTFSAGAVIQAARGGYCENWAISGIRLLNEQGNVAFEFPVYQLEQQNAGGLYSVGCHVGLNYQLVVTTSATVA